MRPAIATALVLLAAASVAAQTRGARRATPSPQAPPLRIVPDMTCPAPLGIGVKTQISFCDVLTGREPADGIRIVLPPHKGPVTLTFDLHNRHTYSEEQAKSNRAYARYTATIGVLTADNTLVSRAVVQSEFRKASDFLDRIAGGAGASGVKAVAPTGTEAISIMIPEEEETVSLLGEKLTVERLDGPPATYTSPGRPIAVISNVMIEYRPPPPKPPPRPVRKK